MTVWPEREEQEGVDQNKMEKKMWTWRMINDDER
jgi:hypothetical protein